MVSSDTSGNWRLVENPETVTLRVKTGEATFTEQTVEYAKRREATRGQQDKLTVQTNVFHLWKAKLAGTVPRPDYEIRDGAGVTWVIDRVRVQSLGERYRCECTRI